MGYYLTCNQCGKPVSSAIPGGTQTVIVRAWIECPECIAAAPNVQQQIAAERERCAKVAENFAKGFRGADELLGGLTGSRLPLMAYTGDGIAAAIRARGDDETGS